MSRSFNPAINAEVMEIFARIEKEQAKLRKMLGVKLPDAKPVPGLKISGHAQTNTDAPPLSLAVKADRLSQYTKGVNVMWAALVDHYQATGKGLSVVELIALLRTAPRKGGHAFYIAPNTVRCYLSAHRGELWVRMPGAGKAVDGCRASTYMPIIK